MPKPPYLSEDDKGWRLRRNIPPRLQPFAAADPGRAGLQSHKSIVDRERLRGLKWADMCKQARQFAVETDVLFDKWEREHARTQQPAKLELSSEPRFTFHLSEHEAEQIALAYFLKRDKAHRATGYTAGSATSRAAEDLLCDAR